MGTLGASLPNPKAEATPPFFDAFCRALSSSVRSSASREKPISDFSILASCPDGLHGRKARACIIQTTNTSCEVNLIFWILGNFTSCKLSVSNSREQFKRRQKKDTNSTRLHEIFFSLLEQRTTVSHMRLALIQRSPGVVLVLYHVLLCVWISWVWDIFATWDHITDIFPDMWCFSPSD